MIALWYWLQENWKDIVEAICAVTVAICAVSALYTWRKEFVGKKKIEFAAEFIEKAIEIKVFITYVRSGFSYESEEKDIENELKKENKYIKDRKIAYLVPKYRILKNDENIKSFYALKTKSFMYFGSDSLKIFDIISQALVKIKISSDALYVNSYSGFLKDEKKQKYEEDIWSSGSSEDKISLEIDNAIKELKLNLEPLYQDKTFKWKTFK